MSHKNQRAKRNRIWHLVFGGALVAAIFASPGNRSAVFGVNYDVRNVPVSATGTTTIDDSDYVSGLVGETNQKKPSTAGGIYIFDGATAIVGVLTEGEEISLKVQNAADLVVERNGAIKVGNPDADTEEDARLWVIGTQSTNSTLTLNGGAVLTVNSNARLQLGGSTTGTLKDDIDGNGLLVVQNGGRLNNYGFPESSTDYKGVWVRTGSQLQLGTSKDALWDSSMGTLYHGDGSIFNEGTINIYNATGDSNIIEIAGYNDITGAVLNATGDLRILEGATTNTLTLSGTLTANQLEVMSDLKVYGTLTLEKDLILGDDVTTFDLGSTTSALATTITIKGDLVSDAEELKITNNDYGTLNVNGTLAIKDGWEFVNDTNDRSGTARTGSNIYTLELSGGRFDNKYGQVEIGNIDQTGGILSVYGTSSTTTTINRGTISEDAQIAVAIGTLYITDLTQNTNFISYFNYPYYFNVTVDANITEEQPYFMEITQTGKVQVSSAGVFTIKNGSIYVDAGSLTTQSFVLSGAVEATSSTPYIPGARLDIAFFDNAEDVLPVFDVKKGTIVFGKSSRVSTIDPSMKAGGEYYAKIVNLIDEDTGQILDQGLITDSSVFTKYEIDDEYNVTLTINDFADFAQTESQKSMGAYLDQLRTNTDEEENVVGSSLRDGLDFIYRNTTTEDAARTILDLAGGVQRANSLMLAMDDPWKHVFNRMNGNRHREKAAGLGNGSSIYDDSYQMPTGGYAGGSYFRGQMASTGYPGADCNTGCSTGDASDGLGPGYGDVGNLLMHRQMNSNSAWGVVHHTSMNANDKISPKYGISRTGVTLGYDLVYDYNTIAGLLFNFSHPYLYSNGHHIDVNNFHLGFYGSTRYALGAELKVYGGLGMQQYDSSRYLLGDEYTTNYGGGSFAFCAQLSKEMQLNFYSILRPLIQVDTQYAQQDAATEKMTGESITGLALGYDSQNWSRTFFRAGIETEVNAEFLQITSRVLYAQQLGGNTTPTMTARFLDVTNPTMPMSLRGTNLQGSFIDAGVGVLGYLDCARRWSIAGNYDLTASSKMSAHTGSLSLAYLY